MVTLSPLLRHLVDHEGIKDEDLPCVQQHGGVVIANLYVTEAEQEQRGKLGGPNRGNLKAIRNRLAHGDPFEMMPWGGLPEVA